MRTTLRFSLLPVDMPLVRKTNVDEDKGSNGILLPGMQISASTVEICVDVPHKTKNRTTTLSSCVVLIIYPMDINSSYTTMFAVTLVTTANLGTRQKMEL